MSQTLAPPAPVHDAYLLSQLAPPQTGPLELTPYGITLVTPIGRVCGVTLDKPRAVAKDKEPNFYLRLLLNPASIDGRVEDVMSAVYKVVMDRFPSENRFDPVQNVTRPYTGWELFFIDEKQGGLWFPIQDGDAMYNQDPAKNNVYKGMKFINASIKDKNSQGRSNQPACFDASGAPMNPADIYLGCYARAVINVFAYPKAGDVNAKSRGVAFTLKSVQFACHGERLSSYDAVSAGRAAFAAAGAIPVNPTAPQGPTGGYAPAAPQGAGPGGFAAPPGFAAPQGPIGPNTPAGGPQGAPLPATYQPGPQSTPPAGFAPPASR
jgi:hypothetical protein